MERKDIRHEIRQARNAFNEGMRERLGKTDPFTAQVSEKVVVAFSEILLERFEEVGSSDSVSGA